MNVLDKVQSVKLLRPEDGDLIIVNVKKETNRQDSEILFDLFKETIDACHPDKNIKFLITNGIEDIKIIRKGD